MKRIAALAAFKLSLYLSQQKNEELFERYSRFLVKDLTEEEFLKYQELPEFLFEDKPEWAIRYRRIFNLLQENAIAVSAFQLYMLICMEPRVLAALEEIFGVLPPGPNIEEAWFLAFREGDSIEHVQEIYEAFQLVKYLLLADMKEQNFLKASFLPDSYLAAWLSGEADIDYILREYCEIWYPEDPLPVSIILKKEKQEAVHFLQKETEKAVIYVCGEKGSGRSFFVRYTAKESGWQVLAIPYDKLEEQGRLNKDVWRLVMRDCQLSGRTLCIMDITKSGEILNCPKEFLKEVEREYQYFDRPLFLTGRSEVKAAAVFDGSVYTVCIEEYNMEESLAFWNYFAEAYLEDRRDFPAEALASRMNLTAGQMNRVMEQYVSLGNTRVEDIRELFRVCYQILDDGRYQNMKIIRGAYTWEDLKLPSYPKSLLKDICNQAEHQITVLNRWGMRKKISYGRSVSALFSGPPGTGKTMAAQVVAASLGLVIYRIDLSQVTDKYIGETEKHLKEVFDQAEKSNMILLFDEADALFGKRSEVTDAKDKYANTEVSYLLQRMEEYTGIVLMTTNLASNIDSAFLRRFRYHVPFYMPGKELRKSLWESMLDDEVPQEEIDFEYLASQFSLSGAQIKNIVLNACYKAAAAEGVLCMKHILEAVFQEGQKEGSLMLSGDFGIYGSLLNGLMQRMNEKMDEK